MQRLMQRPTFRRGPRRAAWLMALVCAFGTAGATVAAQQASATDGLDVLQLRPDVYLIAGAGGNIAVQIGDDGVVLVDTGNGTRTEQVLAEIRKLTDKPIRYIINTSADPDHVGGNDALSEAGESIVPTGGLNAIAAAGGRAPILAEENVLARMSAPTGEQSSFPIGAWPTSSYSSALQEHRKDIYLNGQAIQVFHQPAATTDGDSVVLFRRSDVIVAGRVLDTTRFPIVDIDKGGSIQGVIDALNQLIVLAVPAVPLVWQDGGTLVIPALGRVCDEADVVDYRDMVTIIRDRVQHLMGEGMTLEQVQQADPAAGYRQRYGANDGPGSTAVFIETIYRSLAAR